MAPPLLLMTSLTSSSLALTQSAGDSWTQKARIWRMTQFCRSFPLIMLSAASAATYSYHLGKSALGPSEAYSALAAAQATVGAVARNAMQFDPGKPVLYHLLLHWFCGWFGLSEAALRAFSVIFGVASVLLVFAYGRELWGSQIGLAAAAIWALNPLALVLARWARMYSMFVALVLAHLLVMAKLRRSTTLERTVGAGILGAAMLYTHLAALFVIAADLIVVVREFRRGERSVSWPPVAIALLLFVPFMPVAATQAKALLFGHWLDWLGVGHLTIATGVPAAGFAVAAFLWLSFGARHADETSEAVLRCSLYAVVPPLALVSAAIVIRPMFAIRYVAPSFAVTAVILAWMLDQCGARVRNDVAWAIMAFCAMLLPLSYASQAQPWREIAMRVAASSKPRETIFFETGFFSARREVDQAQNEGFPQGFFMVPFAYYFKQRNPKSAVPGDDPLRDRQLIENAARKAAGAWLISGKSRANAVAELPSGAVFQTDLVQDFSRVLLLHVRPVKPQARGEPELSRK
jgi:hypothetical protein